MNNPLSGEEREALAAVGIEPSRDSLDAMLLKLAAAVKDLQDRVTALEG